MTTKTIQLPIRTRGWLEDDDYPVFDLRRGPERTRQQKEIFFEVLKAVHPAQPTKTNLQQLCKIRRVRFLKLLKGLVESGDVVRDGRGTKSNPFTYKLADRIINPVPGRKPILRW